MAFCLLAGKPKQLNEARDVVVQNSYHLASPDEAAVLLFRASTYAASPTKIASRRRERRPGGSVNGSQDGSPGRPNVRLSIYAKKAPPAIITPSHQPHARPW